MTGIQSGLSIYMYMYMMCYQVPGCPARTGVLCGRDPESCGRGVWGQLLWQPTSHIIWSADLLCRWVIGS